MSKPVFIIGSARSDGNTFLMADYLHQEKAIERIDLSKYNIGDYDYQHRNRGDGFIPLMKGLIYNYDTLVFLSPIYWYSMSAVMKRFFDRITDLLTIEKELGRKLRGKNMAMICCSGSEQVNIGFEEPFSLTAGYLGMNYLGGLHLDLTDNILNQEDKVKLLEFYKKLTTV
jgi:multimeric flavodoxin WrbA